MEASHKTDRLHIKVGKYLYYYPILQIHHARSHARTYTCAHANIHAPPSPFMLSLFDGSVRPAMTKVTPFFVFTLAMNGRSLLHSNKHPRMQSSIRDSFGCFSHYKILVLTETQFWAG